jgi:hypothetical protein
MKRFILRTFIIIATPALLFIIFVTFVLPVILTYTSGPSTESQIKKSFENVIKADFDILILGNSRIYRGVNPDLIPNSYNFSHDNDSYNQIYYKLIYLQENEKKFKHLVLGVDYFQFNIYSDTRNYVYKNYLNNDYLKDYKKEDFNISSYIDLTRNKLKGMKLSKVDAYMKDNGQYILPGLSTPQDSVNRSSKRLQFQVEYFEEILKYCESNNIQVFMVMPPVRRNELNNYTEEELKNFDAFIDKYTSSRTKYFNFSIDEDFSDKDFTDITHLNELSADRFSEKLNVRLQTNITSDFVKN